MYIYVLIDKKDVIGVFQTLESAMTYLGKGKKLKWSKGTGETWNTSDGQVIERHLLLPAGEGRWYAIRTGRVGRAGVDAKIIFVPRDAPPNAWKEYVLLPLCAAEPFVKLANTLEHLGVCHAEYDGAELCAFIAKLAGGVTQDDRQYVLTEFKYVRGTIGDEMQPACTNRHGIFSSLKEAQEYALSVSEYSSITWNALKSGNAEFWVAVTETEYFRIERLVLPQRARATETFTLIIRALQKLGVAHLEHGDESPDKLVAELVDALYNVAKKE